MDSWVETKQLPVHFVSAAGLVWKDEKVLLIPQCETLEALENIEEIVKIQGIDGIFIGPYDLSICMGIPTQFDHPDFKAAVERIRKACRESGKLCMIYTTTIEEARMRLAEGFEAISHSLDAALYAQVYREAMAAIRPSAEPIIPANMCPS